MTRSLWKMIGGLFLAGSVALFAQNPPQPGTLNYTEGQVSIGAQVLGANSVGSVQLQAGQVLRTDNGKAEILLTPGIFLRVGQNSTLQMDSPGLADTELTLLKGRAMVEVAEIHPDNNIVIHENGANVRLVKKGLYDLDANQSQVRVFDGKAEVQAGAQNVDVNGGHELALNQSGKLKTHGFDKNAYEDDLYRWASLRSSYLAEANVDAARMYVAGGTGFYGTGWYWDPWFSAYTWIPGNGLFWSPFGFGYYSPFVVYAAPIGRFGYYHRFGPNYRPAVAPNAFRAAPMGRVGGGFAVRGGGGFHGGGGRR
jgi:hypothetical protein